MTDTPDYLAAVFQPQGTVSTFTVAAGFTGAGSAAIPEGAAAFSLVVSAPSYNILCGTGGQTIRSRGYMDGTTPLYGVLPAFGNTIGVQLTAGPNASVTGFIQFLPPGAVAEIANDDTAGVAVVGGQVRVAPISVAMSPLGTVHIIPAPVTGITIHLVSASLDVSLAGAAAGSFQDTAGNNIHNLQWQNGAPKFIYWGNYPLSAGQGVGLDFRITGALSSCFMGGSVSWYPD